MSRTITSPTDESLRSLLNEPVEVHIAPGEEGVAQVSVYRGILMESEEAWLVRDLGSYAVLHYREQHPWSSIRRLEAHELTPDEQQRWMAHEPIAVMVYVQLEASPKPSLPTLSL
jgi:hypothetical protein